MLVNQGDGASRKPTNWTSIVSKTKKYERHEADLIALCGANAPNEKKIGSKTSSAVRELISLQSWLKNKGNHAAMKGYEADYGAKVNGMDGAKHEFEFDQEVKRGRAIHVLMVSVNAEIADLRSGRFRQTQTTYTDANLDSSEDNAFGGQTSKVDTVSHGGEAGIFQSERTADKEYGNTAAASIGMKQFNANYAGRAIAMKLLGVGGLIVDTDFAVHTREVQDRKGLALGQKTTMGIRMSVAKGEEVSEEMRDGFDAEHPVFQKGMAQLQMLDSRCN
ncbi:MAG: hypothetical protein ACI9MR_002028 [Myxococcota bacterium]